MYFLSYFPTFNIEKQKGCTIGKPFIYGTSNLGVAVIVGEGVMVGVNVAVTFEVGVTVGVKRPKGP
jgi:hypothetical protein